MAGNPAETIQLAAEAYIAGEGEDLEKQLAVNVRLHGSHRNDNWRTSEAAIQDLGIELGRHKRSAAEGTPPRGGLVDLARAAELTNKVGEEAVGSYQAGNVANGMAWWTARGSLDIDGNHIPDASWTVILDKDKDGNWTIVHSHFSIHHVPDGRSGPRREAAS